MSAYKVHVNARPTTKVNTICVGVGYEKDANPPGIYLEFAPVTMEKGCIILMGVSDPAYKSESTLLAPLKRLNSRLLADHIEMADKQIAHREGGIWDKLVAFAARRGLEILPPAA